MLFVRVAVIVIIGSGCPNIMPSAKRAVSEQIGAAAEVVLVSPTTAPALNPAAPAMASACERALATRSARLQVGVCCAEVRVPDKVKDRLSPLLFCEIDFCNAVRAAVVSLSLEN